MVGMADFKTCRGDDAVTTLGLGSCVGIAVRDPATGIGGLAHIMLPDSTEIKNNTNRPKFADTGIEAHAHVPQAMPWVKERLKDTVPFQRLNR